MVQKSVPNNQQKPYFRWVFFNHQVKQLCSVFNMHNVLHNINKLFNVFFLKYKYKSPSVNHLSSVCLTCTMFYTMKTSYSMCFLKYVLSPCKQAMFSPLHMYNVLHYENKLFNEYSLHLSYFTWYKKAFQIINRNHIFDGFSLITRSNNCVQCLTCTMFYTI